MSLGFGVHQRRFVLVSSEPLLPHVDRFICEDIQLSIGVGVLLQHPVWGTFHLPDDFDAFLFFSLGVEDSVGPFDVVGPQFAWLEGFGPAEAEIIAGVSPADE